jgi:hypothetical protein
MGRKPKQEPIKEYLENDRTRFMYSSPSEYREMFGDLSEKYLTRATGKKNPLGPKTFRVVVHLPNKEHANRENYLAKLEKGDGWLWNTFLKPDAPLYRNRIRWDAGSYSGAHLRLGRKGRGYVDYYLTPSKNPRGAVVNGQITFPTADRTWVPLKSNTKDKKAVTKADGSKGKWRRGTKLVACRVTLGTFNVSASKKDQFKLTLGNPEVRCPTGLVGAGKAPIQFTQGWEPTVDDGTTTPDDEIEVTILPLNAEEYGAETVGWFYEAQGYDNLLEIQDVEIMDSETEQQAIERAYYNPSEAMVGTDETLDGYRPIDSATVDLTSNQPMANYGAEGETATYAPSDEPDMVSSSSFDEPTNANFSAEGCPNCGFAAEGETVADVEASVEPANEPLAVAEGTSLNGYAPLDSLEEGAPIGHGVNQYFGSAETSFAMEGVEGALLDESTTNIGIEEGVSLDNFSGVDSVVVEAPLGHGVTQWYAEGEDGPSPQFDSGITGQDGPSDTPTNEYFALEEATRKKIFKKYGRKAFVEPDDLGWPIMNLEGTDKQAKSALWVARGKNIKPSVRSKVRKAVHKMWPNLALGSEHHKGQGYNDEQDESLGMRHRGGHKQSFKDRRDEASAMDRKGRMGRKYDDVMAMDAQGYDDKMDDSLGMRHRGSHSQSFKDRRDEASAMDKKHGGRKYHDVGTMDKFNAIVDGRDSKGRFSGRKTVHDNNSGKFLRQGADTAGYLQDGSLSMDGYTPLESVDVDRTSYQPNQNYGADGITSDHPFIPAVKTGAGIAVGLAIPGLLIGTAAMLAMGLMGKTQ